MATDELKALLGTLISKQSELISKQDELVQEFRKNITKKKDIWDKLSSIATFVSGVLIAGVGLTLTLVYNQQQQADNRLQAERDNNLKSNQLRLNSVQAIGQFMPSLTGTDQHGREAALLLINELTDPTITSKIAPVFEGIGSVNALKKIALSGDDRARLAAGEGLANIALYGKSDDQQFARNTLEEVFKDVLYSGKPGDSINIEIVSEIKPVSLSASLDEKKLDIEDDSLTVSLSANAGQSSYLFIKFRGNVGDEYTVQVSGESSKLKHIVKQTESEVTSLFLLITK